MTNRKTYIYIISNPVFEGWYKIGRTLNIERRLYCYQTSDPLRRFKVELCIEVDDPRTYEYFFSTFTERKFEWVKADLDYCKIAIEQIRLEENVFVTGKLSL